MAFNKQRFLSLPDPTIKFAKMSQINNTTTTTITTKYAFSLPYETISDKRTQGWLLVNSIWNVITFVIIYLLLVNRLPKLMKKRKPYELNSLLVLYNFSMAALNARICQQLISASSRLNYNYLCQPCREIFNEDEIRIASAVWWFYFSKLLEFSDTFFFILRKKWEQLSFLHVYHHSTMFPLWWIAVKWVPTGSTFFPAMVNSCVHVVMYSYYGLSACGPSVRKYLWWKRYLTVLQLMQFVAGLLWAIQAIIFNCDFPLWINCATIVYMISFLILFGRFYARKYQKTIKIN